MTHATEPISGSRASNLDRKPTTHTCPDCGEAQPVSLFTLDCIRRGEVSVCNCLAKIVAPSPARPMPAELQVMPS